MSLPDFEKFRAETNFVGEAAGNPLGRHGLVMVGERNDKVTIYPDDSVRYVARLAVEARAAGLRPTSDGRLVQDEAMTEASLARLVDWLEGWTGIDQMVGTHGQYHVEAWPGAWAWRVSCQRSGHGPLKRLADAVYDRASDCWRVPAADADDLAAILDRAVTAKIVTDTTEVRLPQHRDVKIDLVEGEIRVGFPRDEALTAIIREVTGIRWDRTIKRWCVSARYRRRLGEALGKIVAVLESRDADAAEIRRVELDAAAEASTHWDQAKVQALSTAHIKIYRSRDTIIVRSPYAAQVVAALKGLGGRWDATMRTWSLPIVSATALHAQIPALESIYQAQAAEKAAAPKPAAQPRQLYPMATAPAIGTTVLSCGSWLVIESYGRPVTIGDDDPSIWGEGLLGHEGERGVMAYLRPASEAEIEAAQAAQAAREANARRRAERRAEINRLVDLARRTENYVPGRNEVVGETIMDTWTIYGGGDRWVIASDSIWYIRNNGADGDYWAANNVITGGAGALGWRLPRDPEIEAALRRLAQEA